jgi:hypothetical protein
MSLRLSQSKRQISFVPKAPQRRSIAPRSSLQKNSLAAAYKITTPGSQAKEEPTHGFEYFPLWLGIKVFWGAINWCFSQALNVIEAMTKLRKNDYRN